VESLNAQWQRFEISNLIRKMLCKMPPNHRLKLTAALRKIVRPRSLSVGQTYGGVEWPSGGLENFTVMCRMMCRRVREGENADESPY